MPGAKARRAFQSQRSQRFLHTRLAGAVSPYSHQSQPQSLPSTGQLPHNPPVPSYTVSLMLKQKWYLKRI